MVQYSVMMFCIVFHLSNSLTEGMIFSMNNIYQVVQRPDLILLLKFESPTTSYSTATLFFTPQPGANGDRTFVNL